MAIRGNLAMDHYHQTNSSSYPFEGIGCALLQIALMSRTRDVKGELAYVKV